MAFSVAERVDEFGDRMLYLPMPRGVRAALSYVANAGEKRVFSVRLADDISLRYFADIAEAYLLHHLERGFPTLENYKKLVAVVPPQK